MWAQRAEDVDATGAWRVAPWSQGAASDVIRAIAPDDLERGAGGYSLGLSGAAGGSCRPQDEDGILLWKTWSSPRLARGAGGGA